MARQQSQNELLVISKVSLIDYYNKNVVPLDKKFKPMSEAHTTGLCMFHHDTDPSLHMWKKKRIYHCFGCGYGGDVVKTHINLRRQYYNEKISVEKAIRDLALEFGIELNEETGDEVKSVFDRAKEVMFEPSYYTIPKDELNLAEFRKLNNRVRSSNAQLRVKVTNFEHLDLVASTLLSGS